MIRASVVLIVCVTILYIGRVQAAAGGDELVVRAAEKAKVEKTVAAKVLTAEEKEAAYSKTLEKRAADILGLLNLKDETKAKNIHDAVVSQYRFLNDWHTKNKGKLKELEERNDDAAKAEIEKLHAELKTQHAKFIAILEANLTAEQIETVKDYIVWQKLPRTYNSYCEILPDLAEEQKAKVHEILKQGREEAMDAGSSGNRTLIFEKYKVIANDYLNSQGISYKKAQKAWKAEQAALKIQGANPGQSPVKEVSPASERK